MANRYTTIKPTEFQQTYDPFPLQEMMQLAQYKQGRQDQINAMLGKAAGEAAIEGGLATQDLAREITKERISAIDQLTDQFHNERDMGKIIQGIAKTKQQWQTDPRVSTVQSDRELKDTILKNMADPKFNTNMMYKAYDNTTGQFSIPEIQQMAASGRMITPQDYGLLVNPGAEAAWGKTIDIIEPDIIEGLVQNEDGTYSSKTGDLDLETVMTRAGGILQNISSNGRDIDTPEALPLEAQSYIEYMKEAYRRDGKEYTFDEAIEDFKDQAALRYKIRRKTVGREGDDSGSGSKKDEIESLLGPSLGPTSIIDASNPTYTEIADKGYTELSKATGFDYFTGKDADGISAYDYVATDDPSLTPEQRSQKLQERNTQQYNEAYEKILQKKKEENKPQTRNVGGQMITVKPMSDRAIEEAAHQETMEKLQKRRLAGLVMTEVAMELPEEKLPQFDANGNVLGFTKEQKALVDKVNKYKEGLLKREAVIQDYREKIPITGKLPTPEQKAAIEARQAKLESIRKEYDRYRPSATEITTLELSNDYYKMGDNFVPGKYKEYFEALDTKTKEVFGNRTFTAKQYALYSKGGELGATDIPINQKQIVNAAKTLAKLPEGNAYFNGRPINAINTKGSSTKGHSMDQLYLSQTSESDEETEDFTKGEVEFNPVSIYYNPNVNKWLTRGTYTRTGVEGKDDLESAVYEIDVTPTMSDILNGDEKMQVAMKDAVHDALLSVPKGTSGIANVGMSDKQLETFGNIHIIHNNDGTYEINGKVRKDGKDVPLSKILREDYNVDPTALSEDMAKEMIYNTWLNQNINLESKEVSSEDHGLMQINDYWQKDSALQQISQGPTDWTTVDWDAISNDPATNITISSDILRYTDKGWDNWTTYNKAKKGEPNSVWENTISKIKQPGGWFAFKNDPKYSQYIKMLEDPRTFGDDGAQKPNAFGLTAPQMAFVVMMAESGGDPTATGKNYK